MQMKRCSCKEDKKCIQGPRGYQGIRGERGPQGPRGPVGPKGETGASGTPNIAYATYVVLNTERLTTFPSIVPILGGADVGLLTELVDVTIGPRTGKGIKLTKGYIYYVSFIISGILEPKTGYFQIIPYINGSGIFYNAGTNVSSTTSNGNASISGGFIVSQSTTADAIIAFEVSSGGDEIDLDGTISIFPIAVSQV